MPSHFLDGDGRLTPASDHLLSTWGRHCLDPQAPHNLLPQLPLGHPPPPAGHGLSHPSLAAAEGEPSSDAVTGPDAAQEPCRTQVLSLS